MFRLLLIAFLFLLVGCFKRPYQPNYNKYKTHDETVFYRRKAIYKRTKKEFKISKKVRRISKERRHKRKIRRMKAKYY
jgi:hypothetical protein